MTTTQALIKARNLLKQGWCQGAMSKRLGGNKYRYCILGAIKAADPTQSQAVWKQCVDTILEAKECEYVDIMKFNDAPGREKSEILKLMDDAIKLAKREESEQ